MRPVVLAFFCVLSFGSASAAQQSIAWITNYDCAVAQARESGKLLVVDFWADWCAPCRTMEEKVFPDPALLAASRAYLFVKVDVEKDVKAATRYNVNIIPTLVFADPWETEIGRREGFVEAKEILQVLSVMPTDYSEMAPAYGRLHDAPGDYDALVDIARFYNRPNLRQTAYQFYERASKTAKARGEPAAMDRAHIGMALARINSGKAKDGEKIVSKRLKGCDPSNEGYLLVALGSAYYHQKKVKQARTTFEQVVARFPGTEAAELAAQNLEKMGAQ